MFVRSDKERMRKNKITCFLLAFFMCFAFWPVGTASAVAIDDIVAEIEDLYSYADTDYEDFNKTSIIASRAKLENLTPGQLDEIAGPLVTPQVTAKYAAYYADTGVNLYDKDEWDQLITELLSFSYISDTDPTQLKTDIDNFREEFSPHFKVLFGEEITTGDLARLLQATRDQIRPVIGLSGAGILANDDNSTMIEKMTGYLYDALAAAVSQSDNVMFQGKFAELGWDKDLLILQAEILAAKIDPDGDARRSLALIAIRSETEPIDDAVLSVGDKPAYSVTIMGADASDLVGWHSMNNSIVAVTPTAQGFDIEAVGPGTTQLLAYRYYPSDGTGSKPEIDWLVRFNVTVSKKPGSGSPGGGGGGGALPGYPIRVQGSTVQESGMVVEIPKDAVKYDTRGDIDRLDENTINAPANSFIPGYIYDFTKIAEGDFLKPITVTLPYKQSAVDFEKYDLSIYWYDEDLDEWVELDDVKVDKDDLTVSGETKKTGYFALIATKKAVLPVEPPVEPELPVLTDISGHWAKANIEYLVKMGAISGYPDNTFKPDNPITRAEFAVVLVKAFDLKAETGKVFDDTASHWAKDYIATAAANGIVTGYSETEFGPDDLITREQMAIMIVKAANLSMVNGELNFSDKADISDWASSYVVTAVQNELMKGYLDNTFKPLGNATRAEAVTVIYNALK